MPVLRDLHDCQVGLSDHTMGFGVACAAISYGATIIEKHLTLDRSEDGVDSGFSMEPDEFSMLVSEVHKAWEAKGEIFFGETESEKNSRKRRRSLYFSEDISSGEILSARHIKRVRPGYGLEPKHFDEIIGKKLKRSVKMGQPITWNDIE